MRLGLGTDISVGYRQPLFGGVPLLLDTYTGAAAAYSLRQLRTGVTDVVRVRIDTTPSAEEDFTAEEITDGTLLSFVGAGNNGYVVTWYDQSGNGNHATQSTAASQPKIVDAGVLVTENGKPAIEFDGVDDGFTTNVPGSAIFDFYSIITVNAGDEFILPDNNTVSNQYYGYIARSDVSATIYSNYGSPSLYVNGLLESPSTREDVKNLLSTGNQLLSVHQGANTSSWSYIELFKRSGFQMAGKAQLIMWFDSDQSANRTAIEANINDHYNIYS